MDPKWYYGNYHWAFPLEIIKYLVLSENRALQNPNSFSYSPHSFS